MDRLNNKANENMKLLLNLQPEEKIVSSNGFMSLQDEYVQVDNTTDIEYGIYFTLNQLLFLNTYENIYENNIFKKIDDAIDNIYHNKQLNKLIDKFNVYVDQLENVDGIKTSKYRNIIETIRKKQNNGLNQLRIRLREVILTKFRSHRVRQLRRQRR